MFPQKKKSIIKIEKTTYTNSMTISTCKYRHIYIYIYIHMFPSQGHAFSFDATEALAASHCSRGAANAGAARPRGPPRQGGNFTGEAVGKTMGKPWENADFT